jgi:hypothetical protein
LTAAFGREDRSDAGDGATCNNASVHATVANTFSRHLVTVLQGGGALHRAWCVAGRVAVSFSHAL